MTNYELYIPGERPQRNPTNGQFLKGIVPHNKGKKWEEWIDGRKLKRMKRLISENLKHNGNHNIGGCNARPIAAYDMDNNFVGWFRSSCDAERQTGICARNIRYVLEGKRKSAGGYKWVYDNNSTTRKE